MINRVRTWLKIYEAEEPVAGQFRAQQVRAILQLTPLTMLANVLNVIVIAVSFWQNISHGVFLIWAVAVMVVAGVGVRAWWGAQRGRMRDRVSPRAIPRATRHAVILALLWAVLPIFVAGSGLPHQQILLSSICVGMICAGGFALSTIPSAAIAYVFIVTAGSVIALLSGGVLQNWYLILLLITYAFIVMASALSSAKGFGARLMAEAEATKQKQLISLLFNDFETHASDWWWEIDLQGFVQHAPARMRQIFGLPLDVDLVSMPFVPLFYSHTQTALGSEEAASIAQLETALSQAKPFRNLPVAAQVGDTLSWWALTAKPLLNESGTLIGWRGVGADITQNRRAELEMRRLANWDTLTGLANRHQFSVQLALMQESGKIKPCALLFMDLDDFKSVNDSLGHALGDQVLQMVAQRLQQRIRRGDLLARLGGDEFALLSWGAYTPDLAAIVATRMLDVFHEPCVVDGVTVQMGGSIGIALAPGDGGDPESLLKSADMALYAAKAAGRHTFRFFEREMDERAQQRLAMQSDLRNALENNEFVLFYQPQIDLKNGRICGFEALVRWQHPTQGLVPPIQFIPLAEETGLIVPIGTRVLQQACLDAMQWPDDVVIAVNVSAVQFAQTDFVEQVKFALAESQLPAARLELEITESLLINDGEGTRAQLTQLRALGARIALDDFGTGYSSLAYLRSFPLDTLKIDRSFVSSLAGDASALAIVQAIVSLAKALGLETTAEGIESLGEFNILSKAGCTDAQGYYMAKPMPLDAALRFLAEWPLTYAKMQAQQAGQA